MPALPRAHPYRDTDVIDVRAPRTNQAVVAVVALAGVIFGWPLAWALMGLQLAIGLTLGRAWCIPCRIYFELIQPRIGEGELEDSRAPRLANRMGAVFLGSAAAAWWLGAPPVGLALGAIVAALAALAAITGFCAGCELYRLRARLKGISSRASAVEGSVDPADFGGLGVERTHIQFTHPLCSECLTWEQRLGAEPSPLIKLDVRERPELARKYGIALVPTVVAVGPEGDVLERLA
ncbi:MAG: DUF4395 family protein [Solirubrobacterales bacterium]